MEVSGQHPVKTQVLSRQYQLSFFVRLPSPARPRTPPITAPRPPPSAPPTAAPLAPSSATFSSSGDSGAFASCSGFAFESSVGFATFFARFFMIPNNQQDAYRVAAGNGAIPACVWDTIASHDCRIAPTGLLAKLAQRVRLEVQDPLRKPIDVSGVIDALTPKSIVRRGLGDARPDVGEDRPGRVPSRWRPPRARRQSAAIPRVGMRNR